jgi:hypothetical protein
VNVALGTVTFPAAGFTAASGEIVASAFEGPLGTETVELEPGFNAATGVILGGGVPGPTADDGLTVVAGCAADTSFPEPAIGVPDIAVLVEFVLPSADAAGAPKSVAISPNTTKATMDAARRPPVLLFI